MFFSCDSDFCVNEGQILSVMFSENDNTARLSQVVCAWLPVNNFNVHVLHVLALHFPIIRMWKLEDVWKNTATLLAQ